MRDRIRILSVEVENIGDADVILRTTQCTEHEDHVFDTPRGSEFDLVFDQEVAAKEFVARPPDIFALEEIGKTLCQVVGFKRRFIDKFAGLIRLNFDFRLCVDLIAGAGRKEEPVGVNNISVEMFCGVEKRGERMSGNEIVAVDEGDVFASRNVQCLIAGQSGTARVLKQLEEPNIFSSPPVLSDLK